MELKWLDDYMALVETGSFSAAAEKRHISQPAFSRRIQLLEEWLGVELIDRSRKPLRFTPIASQHEAAFRRLTTQIYEFRSTLKSDATSSPGLVIAAQHSLASAHLPAFLQKLQAITPTQRFRIRSENRAEGITMLVRGQADILLTYVSALSAIHLPLQLASTLTLGEDALVLVASRKLCASDDFLKPGHPLPLLCFPPESFFGEVLRTHALPELMQSRSVSIQCVSEFSLGLREMALIDQGAAWLPRSLIAKDLKRGTLQELPTIGREVPLTIMAYFANHGNQELRELFAKFNTAPLKHANATTPRST